MRNRSVFVGPSIFGIPDDIFSFLEAPTMAPSGLTRASTTSAGPSGFSHRWFSPWIIWPERWGSTPKRWVFMGKFIKRSIRSLGSWSVIFPFLNKIHLLIRYLLPGLGCHWECQRLFLSRRCSERRVVFFWPSANTYFKWWFPIATLNYRRGSRVAQISSEWNKNTSMCSQTLHAKKHIFDFSRSIWLDSSLTCWSQQVMVTPWWRLGLPVGGSQTGGAPLGGYRLYMNTGRDVGGLRGPWFHGWFRRWLGQKNHISCCWRDFFFGGGGEFCRGVLLRCSFGPGFPRRFSRGGFGHEWMPLRMWQRWSMMAATSLQWETLMSKLDGLFQGKSH